jgi:hypothetical protein
MARMDATENRQTHKITFNGGTITVMRPTGGQSAVAMVATTGGRASGSDLKRLFSIMQALCVDPQDWDNVEQGLIDGVLDIPDLTRLARQIFDHDWPEPAKVAKKRTGARAARKPARVDDDDPEDE